MNLPGARPRASRAVWPALLAAAVVTGFLTAYRAPFAAIAVGGVMLLGLSLIDLSWPIAALLLTTMIGGEYGIAHANFSLGGLNLFPDDLLVLLLGFGLLIRFLRHGGAPGRLRDPIDFVLAAYLLYGVFSVARSWPTYGSAALSPFRLQFVYGLLYFLGRAALAEPAARRRIGIAVLIAAGAIGIIGIGNLVTGTPAGGETGSHTYRYLSGLQATVLVFGLAILSVVWSRRRPPWSLALGALCLFGILISQARSVWIGVVAAVIVAVASSASRTKLARRLIAGAVVAVLIGLAVVGAGLGRDLTGDLAKRAASLGKVNTDVTAMWRVFVWGVALKDLSHSPVLGLGLGRQFTYYDLSVEKWESNRQLHNSYLELAYYTGAVGLLLLIAFQVLVLVRTARAARAAHGTPREPRLLALIACQVCLYAVAATNVVSASLVASTWWWLLAAVSIGESSAVLGAPGQVSPETG